MAVISADRPWSRAIADTMSDDFLLRNVVGTTLADRRCERSIASIVVCISPRRGWSMPRATMSPSKIVVDVDPPKILTTSAPPIANVLLSSTVKPMSTTRITAVEVSSSDRRTRMSTSSTLAGISAPSTVMTGTLTLP
ncbi:MAG: hypothetical protein QM733_08500 [Ilumatobacteraceae bacterium]